MMSSIDLDDELRLERDEVDDVWAIWCCRLNFTPASCLARRCIQSLPSAWVMFSLKFLA